MKHLTKKILVTIAIIFSFVVIVPSAYADPLIDTGRPNDIPEEDVPATSTSSSSDIGDCNNTFLGMTPWYCGVKSNPGSEQELKENVWTIVANIFVDLGIIAIYLAIGYTMYGGYLYMFSSGDVGKLSVGKKTLTRAFIGLAIVMLANIILNTIRIAIFNGNGTFQNCNPAVNECVNPTTLVENLINWFIGASSIVAVIFIVIGGIGYITSQGDPGKLQKAKSTILYALIGLIIVTLARIIVAFVYDIVRKNSDFEDNYSNTSLVIDKNHDKIT